MSPSRFLRSSSTLMGTRGLRDRCGDSIGKSSFCRIKQLIPRCPMSGREMPHPFAPGACTAAEGEKPGQAYDSSRPPRGVENDSKLKSIHRPGKTSKRKLARASFPTRVRTHSRVFNMQEPTVIIRSCYLRGGAGLRSDEGMFTKS
jgi:hypothetical protein